MRRVQSRLAALAMLSLCLLMCTVSGALAIERASWLRYPAISPDGKSIVFAYKGNLWKIASSGGVAVPLTVGASYNTKPVWSPDGSRIAFASDRNGNLDVYVMSSEGGEATRLTLHSADETPTSFTPDGKAVLFTSTILDAPSSVQFPNPSQSELYQVPLAGGMPKQLLTTPANHAVWDRTGKRLAYSDQPGFEMEWRKHDHSSFARQVWVLDTETQKHTRLTAPGFDNRQPVWSADGATIYFLSERSGSFNVWRMSPLDPTHATAVTTHTVSPVRSLSVSNAGDVCYSFDGELHVRPAGASASRKLDVMVAADRRSRLVQPLSVNGQLSEFDVSPDGSEIAFIARGEVFVASTEHGDTRRITNTPEQERSVSFAPNGRALLYAGERGERWKLFRTDLTDKDEPNFFNATALRETLLLAGEHEAFQSQYSPDGSEIAYLEDRVTLKVLNLKSGRTRQILGADQNYSYSDGDQAYEWSPDGKWFTTQFLTRGRWSSEVGLIPSSGEGKLANITHSGYDEGSPHFTRKGEVLYWQSDRHGLRTHSGEGTQDDVYAAFLTQKAWDRYKLDEAAYAQLIAKEKDAKGDKGDKDAKGKSKDKPEAKPTPSADADAKQAPTPVPVELDQLEDRIARLSLSSADLSTALLSPDGEALYYMAKYDKGYDLWKYVPREHEVKLVTKFGASSADFKLSPDGKKAFVLADGRLATVELDAGKQSSVDLTAKMELNEDAERAYFFEHIWRQTFEKFLDIGMHGTDWKRVKSEYAKFLPFIDNNRDFAEMASEMQGELNASHTGCRFRPARPDGDDTAALGFFPDAAWTGAGVAIAEVMDGGPLHKTGSKAKAGVVITAIDGVPIPAGFNWYALLNHKADTAVRLALLEPKSNARWEESVRPISSGAQSRLLYLRWERSRRAAVEKLSGGRLGYSHIRGMNDGAYREVYDEIFGRHTEKEALLLDTRFNGGGNLDEALTQFLTGRAFETNEPRGQFLGTEPSHRWSKPSIVIMNQGNYSDAHCFPTAFTQLGIGETVGMPVPGTCSSVWWETLQDKDLVFGIPQVAIRGTDGVIMENSQLDPTYQVEPDPAKLAAGRDEQLEKAVEIMLAKLKK